MNTKAPNIRLNIFPWSWTYIALDTVYESIKRHNLKTYILFFQVHKGPFDDDAHDNLYKLPPPTPPFLPLLPTPYPFIFPQNFQYPFLYFTYLRVTLFTFSLKLFPNPYPKHLNFVIQSYFNKQAPPPSWLHLPHQYKFSSRYLSRKIRRFLPLAKTPM